MRADVDRVKNGRVEDALAGRRQRTRVRPRGHPLEQSGPDLDCVALARARVAFSPVASGARRRTVAGQHTLLGPWTVHGDQLSWPKSGMPVRANLRAAVRSWRHGDAGTLDDDLPCTAELLSDYPAGLRAAAGAIRHFALRGSFTKGGPAAVRQEMCRGILAEFIEVAHTRSDVRALLAAGARPNRALAWNTYGAIGGMLADGQLPAGLVSSIDVDDEDLDGPSADAVTRLLDSPARRLLVPGALARLGRVCWETLRDAFLHPPAKFKKDVTLALLRLSAKVGALLTEELAGQ